MSRSLDDLHPDLKPLCEEHLERCKIAGLFPVITFTFRTPQEQDDLYAQGRTKPGKIVTYLKGYKSKHCFTIDGKPASKAYDLMFKNIDGSLINNGDAIEYEKAAIMGKDLGLECGFFWKKFKDSSHYELKE